MSEMIDTSTLKPFLTDLAKQAGEISLTYFKSEKERLGAREKGSLDVVTEADLEIDAFVANELKKAYPTIPVLTEETSNGEFSSFEHLEYVWVIDPIDGTINFSRGDINYCICIGLVSHGQPIAGVVYAPKRSELYYGDAQGAVCNDEPIKVSQISTMEETVICMDRGKQPEVFQATIDIMLKTKGKILQVKLMGSAALAICFVADGMIDGYFHKHLYPWDVAAAAAIAKAAGATITSPGSATWTAFQPTVLIANPQIHPQLEDIISSTDLPAQAGN